MHSLSKTLIASLLLSGCGGGHTTTTVTQYVLNSTPAFCIPYTLNPTSTEFVQFGQTPAWQMTTESASALEAQIEISPREEKASR